MELLRVAMRRESETNPVWVHGLIDRSTALIVTRLHEEPGKAWTLEAMSRIGGLSRSALDRRFRTVVRDVADPIPSERPADQRAHTAAPAPLRPVSIGSDGSLVHSVSEPS